jgi:hypothetical protein
VKERWRAVVGRESFPAIVPRGVGKGLPTYEISDLRWRALVVSFIIGGAARLLHES